MTIWFLRIKNRVIAESVEQSSEMTFYFATVAEQK